MSFDFGMLGTEILIRVSLDLFVGVVLLLASLLVAGRARRFPGNALLAAFLFLVAVNFLVPSIGLLTGDSGWDKIAQQIAYVALALDPIFLVAFAAVHPYPRWTNARVAILAWLCVVAAVSIPIVVLRPEWMIAYTFDADMRSPARFLLLLGGLGIGYASAWFIAIRTLRDSPTLGLAQRAVWTALAIGVAVLPRLPQVPNELGLLGLMVPFLDTGTILQHGELRWQDVAWWLEPAWRLSVLAIQLFVLYALLRPAVSQLRAARMPTQETRRLFRALGAIVLALLALQAILHVLADHLSSTFWVPSVPFAPRWIVFAAILAYGVSVHQVLPLPDSNRAALPLAGGLVLSLGGALLVLPQASGATGDSSLSAGIAAGTGLAFFMPGVLLTRKALQRAERQPTGYADLERRLVLYRAALESAWARGPPSVEARLRLNRLRLEFGLSQEEAKVLEHVVRDSFRQAEDDLLPGEEAFPGVIVGEVLGAGSQGRTYLAQTLPAGDPVVVKQLRAASSPEARKRLRGELHALRQVRHPSLPRLLDFSLAPSPRLLYTFIDGRPLSGLLDSGPLPEAQVRRLASELGDALEHLHERGIVHGDVKPENILVDAHGHAVLIDFGLAHDTADLNGPLAGLDGWRLAGTLSYMAPERAHAPAGPASDWYSLGLTLAEALTGRPRRRLAGRPLYKALESLGEPVDLADIPAEWKLLLDGLLKVDPRRRSRAIRLPSGVASPSHASELGDQESAASAHHVP